MIDYEKLKLAHELAEKIDCVCEFEINVNFPGSDNFKLNYGRCEDHILYTNIVSYRSIDDLIVKLKELTQPGHKYEVGQTWWYLEPDIGEQFPIPDSLVITKGNKNWSRKDDEWYPSKQALIEAQIAHWQSLRESIIDFGPKLNPVECRHEYKKTLAESGMYFIDMCHKCMSSKPYIGPGFIEKCEHESNGILKDNSGTFELGCYKCKKCGEYFK